MDNVRDRAKRESIYVKTQRTYISCSRVSKEASVAGAERTRERVEGDKGEKVKGPDNGGPHR